MVTTTRDSQAQLRANEDRMSDVLDETRATLASDTARVTEELTRLAAVVAAHSRIDTSVGILEDLLREAPRLAAEVERLERDHRDLPGMLIALRMRARQLENDINSAVARLDEHQGLIQHLVYEAFVADLGDGD